MGIGKGILSSKGRGKGREEANKNEGSKEMIERWQEKLRQLQSQREKKIRFVQHLQHQEQRLNRIAQLMEVPPSDIEESLSLMLQYWQSAGMIRKEVIKLPK